MQNETRPYPDITNEEFDRRLQEKVVNEAEALLLIPGVYEAVSEHFNNDILDEYEDDNEHFIDYDAAVESFLDLYDCRTVAELKAIKHDDIMLREDFNNYTDMLCKDGQISEWAYENWDNPF